MTCVAILPRMKLLLAVVMLVVVASADDEPSADWEASKVVSKSISDFGFALFMTLGSVTQGNLVFSPASAHMILTLTAQGARGSTAQQMLTGLQLPDDQATVRKGYHELLASLSASPNVTLKVANKIFTDLSHPPTDEFKEIATRDFLSSSGTADFRNHPDEGRREVNGWVEEQTESKIKDLLQEDDVKPDTVMILANAIYFKGSWMTAFSPANTVSKPFHVSPDDTKEVPMMHLKSNSFSYEIIEDLNAEILEMYYVGRKMSLVIILPRERFGLADVEERLGQMTFRNATANLRRNRQDVKLALPKFKLEVATKMEDVLKQLGMTLMFGDTADFSGMTSVPTSVSTVAHKAFIEINEEGTEAAAATGVVGVARTHRVLPEVTFTADHPFLFALVHITKHGYEEERSVLFFGKFVTP